MIKMLLLDFSRPHSHDIKFLHGILIWGQILLVIQPQHNKVKFWSWHYVKTTWQSNDVLLAAACRVFGSCVGFISQVSGFLTKFTDLNILTKTWYPSLLWFSVCIMLELCKCQRLHCERDGDYVHYPFILYIQKIFIMQ